MPQKIISTHIIHAQKKGPTILFLGAVHGNEKCGTRAMKRAIQSIVSRKIHLLKGKVVFVPIANPLAYRKNRHFVQENLNRIIKRTKHPRSYEARLANELCGLIEKADVVVDLHSMTAKGKPFYYLDVPNKKNRALGTILGPKLAVTGWPELYRKLGRDDGTSDTVSYATRLGKLALILECGQHGDSSATAVAYRAILNSLKHYGLIKGVVKPRTSKEVRVKDVFFRGSARERFSKNWNHFDFVKKGQSLIIDDSAVVVRAPYTGYIVMPNAKAPVADDWLYFGK